MKNMISARSIVTMFPADRSIQALYRACNKTGLRIETPKYKLHVTLAMGGPLAAADTMTMGCHEVMVISGIGKCKAAWVITLSPVYPHTTIPMVERIRNECGSVHTDLSFHMSLAGCNSHPDFITKLSRAAPDLVGVRLVFDRISKEPLKFGGSAARKYDIHVTRDADTKRRW